MTYRTSSANCGPKWTRRTGSALYAAILNIRSSRCGANLFHREPATQRDSACPDAGHAPSTPARLATPAPPPGWADDIVKQAGRWPQSSSGGLRSTPRWRARREPLHGSSGAWGLGAAWESRAAAFFIRPHPRADRCPSVPGLGARPVVISQSDLYLLEFTEEAGPSRR